MKGEKDAIEALKARFPGKTPSEIFSLLLKKEPHRIENAEEKLREVMSAFREPDIYVLIKASILDGIGKFLPTEVTGLARRGKAKSEDEQDQFIQSREDALRIVEKIRNFDGGLFKILALNQRRNEYRDGLNQFAQNQNDSEALEKFLLNNQKVLGFLHENLGDLREAAQDQRIKNLDMVKEAADYISPSQRDNLTTEILGDDLGKKFSEVREFLSNPKMFSLVENMILNLDKFGSFISEGGAEIKALCTKMYEDLETPLDYEDKYGCYQESSVNRFMNGAQGFHRVSERSGVEKLLSGENCAKLIGFFHDNINFFKDVEANIQERILQVAILKEEKSILFIGAMVSNPEGFVELLFEHLNTTQAKITQDLFGKIQKNIRFLGNFLEAMEEDTFQSFLYHNLKGLNFLSENIENFEIVIAAVPEAALLEFISREMGDSASVGSGDSGTPKYSPRVTGAESARKTPHQLGSD